MTPLPYALTGTDFHQALKLVTFGNPLIPTLDTPLVCPVHGNIIIETVYTLAVEPNNCVMYEIPG